MTPLEPDFLASPEALAAAIAGLAAEDALSLPLIGAAQCARLTAAAEGLRYRPAKPVFGANVHQDFEICDSFPPDGPFHAFAEALGRLTLEAMALMDPNPYPGDFAFNDLVMQRYPVGRGRITPHRDHIRYEALVAIITLAGAGRFFVCADRAGREAREIPSPEGGLLLMRAPGLAGRRDRPFHMLHDVTRRRVSFGLRYDISR